MILSATNGFRNNILWEDVSAVEVEGGRPDAARIKIFDRRGGAVRLSLGGMSVEDVEYFLVSLENWLPKESLSPQVGQLRSALWTQSQTPAIQSYTEIWEEELSAHFSATAYIPLAPGQLLQNDSIKIIKQLNIGGWSAIYLVQEANTRLRVLKEAALPQDARSEMRDKAIAMFSREAQFLMKLDHPHIVKVYNYFEEAGRQYLLIDFVSGTNLRQLVKTNGALHKLDILDYAIRICDVLDYMHGLKPPMVHRDITPENLVVSSDGELKLIDFGAANELLGTATGTMVGKQSYMPIEQFRGKAVTQSDLYAMGATLFYLSTGQDPEPLQSCNPRDSGAQIDEGLNQLIIALTSQNPGDRPQSALDVKTRLIALRR
jgi:tRNA A-37 threonylcarbamoyl transferase component Bud32